MSPTAPVSLRSRAASYFRAAHHNPRQLTFARLRTPAVFGAMLLYLVMAAFGTLGLVTTGWLAESPTTLNMALTAIFVIGGTLLFTLAGVVWVRVIGRAEGRLRSDLLTAAMQQPLAALQEQGSGELLDRVDDDTQALSRTFRDTGSAVLRLASDAPMLWVVAGLTWWPAWLLFPALVAAVYLLNRADLKRVAKLQEKEEEAWTAHAAAFEEAVSARDDIRTSLGQAFVVRRLAELSREVNERMRLKNIVEARLFGSAGFIVSSVLAGTAMAGAALAVGGGMSVAALVTLFLVTARMTGVVSLMANLMPQIQEGVGAVTRIRKLLDAAPEPAGGSPLPGGDVGIDIVGLNFAYPPRDLKSADDGEGGGAAADSAAADSAEANHTENDGEGVGAAKPFALRDITLRVPAGHTIALVGRTGSGKSTLASILSRAVEPPPGTVFLGGLDITAANIEALRGSVGVVTQRTEMLSGTLRENITMFAPVPPGAVERALDLLGLADWAQGLPDGLETKIGAGGTKLSAGEEQLVSFARLLVRDVQVVVLDEATARMDPVTEARVVAASQRLLSGRTGVIVAHRLSTIERADLIAVLDNGQVLQFGDRAELSRAPGRYRELLEASRTGALTSADEVDEVPLVSAGAAGAAGAVGAAGAAGVVGAAGPAGAVGAAGAAGAAGTVGAAGAVAAASGASAGSKEDGEAGELAAGRRKGAKPDRPAPGQGMGLMRAVARTFAFNKRWGLLGALAFTLSGLFAAQGPVVGLLWGDVVVAVEAGVHRPWLLTGLALSLYLGTALVMFGIFVYARWWTQNSLRIRLNVMRGQTSQTRLPATPAGEVVGRAMDTDRFIRYADMWIDVVGAVLTLIITAVMGFTWIAGAILLAIMGSSSLLALAGRSLAGKTAKAAADARARYGRELVSTFDASRSVKLSARTAARRQRRAEVDADRMAKSIREQRVRAWLSGLPVLVAFTGSVTAWFLFYLGVWQLPVTMMVAAAAVGFIYPAFVARGVITEAPGVRAWQVATQEFADGMDLITLPPGVDTIRGLAPAPPAPGRSGQPSQGSAPFERLDLRGVTTLFDDDGTIGVSDVNLSVGRGELVLLLGRVGSGKSSLLSMLAGLTSYEGEVCWNGERVTDPEHFLRPGRVAYVSQLPRVLSGSIKENIQLDHPERAVDGPIRDARLTHDVETAGGLDAMVGQRGVKLSGGQAQRLALARALACDPDVLLADDVSSALDAATELELWDALRARGITVIGSTSKGAALARADRVLVVAGGEVVASGPWSQLAADWSHLAG